MSQPTAPMSLSPTSLSIANTVSSFLIGLIFGIGLIIAGMSNPTKVLAFLDLAGAWEPSLIVVMLSAIPIAAIGFRFARKRRLSVLHCAIQLPSATHFDARLIIGSILFGVGWGIAGICPGPAIVLLGSGAPKAFWFLSALGAGMLTFELLQRLPQLFAKGSKQ